MDSVNFRNLIVCAFVTIFLALCVHFSKKAEEGPWHSAVVELWEKEEWHKLRSLGQNLHRIGKEDVESFHLAMLASQELKDPDQVRFFASLISDSRVLNLKVEWQVADSFQPDTLREKMALFRTRMIFALSILLVAVLIFSWRRNAPYQFAPAVIAATGILVLWL